MGDKTILESQKEITVYHEADVVVVGGGPAGHSAAVAAARNGAKTVLVERYGHLGGMATGGLVILIPHMSDGTGQQQIAGLCQEWIDRLDKVDGVIRPKREELGSDDEQTVSHWKRYFGVVTGGRVTQTVTVDPELLKCVLNEMVEEAGVKLFLHSWGSRAVVEDGRVIGVIFESKSGRHAIMGKIIIDATGDGDIMATAGADHDSTVDHELRSSQLALVFRLGNVDFNKFSEFKEAEPEKYNELMAELQKMAGTRMPAFPTNRNDVVWVNNWIRGVNAINVEDITSVEVGMRKKMLLARDFYTKNIPGFENCFIMDTASQLGTRGSRRLVGEYVVTKGDILSADPYEDTVAIFPRYRPDSTGKYRHFSFPYRALVPRDLEGLLVAGRCFSSDPAANDIFNLIPHCAAMGEAAGTAAALAVRHGISPKQVNYRELQECLIKQGVPLPDVFIAEAESASAKPE